ncbi:unnamed protein product [Taenia asiatica]|uniref:Uncharacterized protein n=1 Tax=Taenia asiatica TaxID=60517 RepID=A0A0R3VTC8_TAEAS|nr:unnamed protein product [Taenia asiatica]
MKFGLPTHSGQLVVRAGLSGGSKYMLQHAVLKWLHPKTRRYHHAPAEDLTPSNEGPLIYSPANDDCGPALRRDSQSATSPNTGPDQLDQNGVQQSMRGHRDSTWESMDEFVRYTLASHLLLAE